MGFSLRDFRKGSCRVEVTSGFREAIHKNHDVSLIDLYYTISRNTGGSHVKIYNETNYGNVYSNTMGDYFE